MIFRGTLIFYNDLPILLEIIMNYRHGYHAGSFSDVFKHIILIQLLRGLLRKEKPFCYIDTHAGAGRYALSSEHMQKTREYRGGILKLMDAPYLSFPSLIQEYVEIIKSAPYPTYYPGSPWIAKTLLRSTDSLILMELHPEEYQILKTNLGYDKRIAIHHQDGFMALKAFLPPKERRGLILIDPSFEQKNEWECILQALKIGLTKFPQGIYAIWYPIKDLKSVQSFINSVMKLSLPNALKIELNIYPSDAQLNLIGCGMLIINPPWQFDKELEGWLPLLWQTLSIDGAGEYSMMQL